MGLKRHLPAIKRYARNVLVSIDQLVNTLFFGDPDETISSRAYKNRASKPWWCLCVLMNMLDKNHCEESVELDEGSDQLTKR